jgi:magnesium-transporting ATPase (P-type)
VRSPLLGLLLAAAIASYVVGQRSDTVIIGVILALSVGLGFVNEYRAEKAAEALHSQIQPANSKYRVRRMSQAQHLRQFPSLFVGG